MARYAQGWKLRKPEGRTIWIVRFEHGGRTVDRSTGESDRGKATERAQRIYAEVVTGVVAPVKIEADLITLFSEWIADYAMGHAPETTKNVEGYAKTLIKHFRTFDRLTPPGYSSYMRERIGKIGRTTLRKELSALRMFASWLKVERQMMLPPVPGLPKHGHQGIRGKRARKLRATILTPAQIGRLLSAMPMRALRSSAWVRPFFEVVWETGLRPYATVGKLEAPAHFRRGATELFIEARIDKVGYDRTIPLSPRAAELLNLVCPVSGGPLFPHAKRANWALRIALRDTGITLPVSIYDFRHSRISLMANSGAPLAGVAYLVGHKRVSTTALYVQGDKEAGKKALMTVNRPFDVSTQAAPTERPGVPGMNGLGRPSADTDPQ